MQADQTAICVCRIAKEFREQGEQGTESAATLFRRSGYLQAPDAMTVEVLEATLRADPALVDEWQRYSEDNRGTPAWYLQAPVLAGRGERCWVVGLYPNEERYFFDDGFQACAFYVKQHVEAIRRWL